MATSFCPATAIDTGTGIPLPRCVGARDCSREQPETKSRGAIPAISAKTRARRGLQLPRPSPLRLSSSLTPRALRLPSPLTPVPSDGRDEPLWARENLRQTCCEYKGFIINGESSLRFFFCPCFPAAAEGLVKGNQVEAYG